MRRRARVLILAAAAAAAAAAAPAGCGGAKNDSKPNPEFQVPDIPPANREAPGLDAKGGKDARPKPGG